MERMGLQGFEVLRQRWDYLLHWEQVLIKGNTKKGLQIALGNNRMKRIQRPHCQLSQTLWKLLEICLNIAVSSELS